MIRWCGNKPIQKKHKRKVAACIDRIIWYSLLFAENEKSVIPYLDMVNSKDNSFVNSLSATKIIGFVENALKISRRRDESEIKVINFFDYKAYFINDIKENEIQLKYRPSVGQENKYMKENGLWMIALCKFKHCGVKYKKSQLNLIPRKNEVLGEKEVKWSCQVIFNNFKVLYKNATQGDIQVHYSEEIDPFSVKGAEFQSSLNKNDEDLENHPWEQNQEQVRIRREKFNLLTKFFL